MRLSKSLDLICGCETTCEREDGSYEIIHVLPGSKCHPAGYVVSKQEARRVRLVNAGWDTAERDWLEQPL